MSAEGQDKIRQMVTDQMIKALEAGTVPWHKPWNCGLPMRMNANKPYRGINAFMLEMIASVNGWSSPWWGSIKEINVRGGKIRKGESPSIAIFYKRLVIEDKETEETKTIPLLRFYKVWNADQCDGLPAKFHPAADDSAVKGERVQEAENVIKEYLENGGPSFSQGGNRAFYVMALDSITVPSDSDFDSHGERYSTIFHEFGHSTGHPARLNRKGVSDFDHFGSEKYADEELVAEMTAAMLCAITGVEGVFDNSAAYIASWLRKLRNDNKLVISAASRAHAAMDYITGIRYDDEGE